MTQTTRREVMALMSGALAGAALGGNALAQGTPKRGGTLAHFGARQPVEPRSRHRRRRLGSRLPVHDVRHADRMGF